MYDCNSLKHNNAAKILAFNDKIHFYGVNDVNKS